MSNTPRKRTSGLERAVQVMDVLVERNKAMSAYELAKVTKAPVTTIYSITENLIAHDMLSRIDDTRIWLGPRLMRYGLTYRSHMNVFTEANREMHRLSKRTGETVQVCSRDEGMMVVIGMAVGEGHFRGTSDVGSRVPINWTASGRLLLGNLPDDERLAAFRDYSAPSQTGLAETDPKKLAIQSLEDFNNRLALQISNSEYSVACIAAPIRDMNGICVLTLSIVLSEQRVKERLSILTDAVQKAAEKVERAIGRKTGEQTLPAVSMETDISM